MMDNYRESWKEKPNTGPVGDEDLGGWMLQENGRPVAQDGHPAFAEGDTSMILVVKALEVIRQSKKDGKPLFFSFRQPDGGAYMLREIDGDWKMIWGLDSLEKREPGKSIDAASPIQLFNLSNDPGEKRDLIDAGDQSARIAAMKKSATEWDLSVLKDFQTHADRKEIRH